MHSDSRMVVTEGCGGKGSQGLVVNGFRVPVGEDDKIWKWMVLSVNAGTHQGGHLRFKHLTAPVLQLVKKLWSRERQA